MSFSFPYFRGRPHVPITFEVGEIRKKFIPLLDSGADYSVFYRSDAIALGLDWKKGQPTSFQSANGSIFHARKFKLKLEIESVPFLADICFVENTKNQTRLLGRHGIFSTFDVLFQERKRRIMLIPNL